MSWRVNGGAWAGWPVPRVDARDVRVDVVQQLLALGAGPAITASGLRHDRVGLLARRELVQPRDQVDGREVGCVDRRGQAVEARLIEQQAAVLGDRVTGAERHVVVGLPVDVRDVVGVAADLEAGPRGERLGADDPSGLDRLGLEDAWELRVGDVVAQRRAARCTSPPGEWPPVRRTRTDPTEGRSTPWWPCPAPAPKRVGQRGTEQRRDPAFDPQRTPFRSQRSLGRGWWNLPILYRPKLKVRLGSPHARARHRQAAPLPAPLPLGAPGLRRQRPSPDRHRRCGAAPGGRDHRARDGRRALAPVPALRLVAAVRAARAPRIRAPACARRGRAAAARAPAARQDRAAGHRHRPRASTSSCSRAWPWPSSCSPPTSAPCATRSTRW